LDEIRSLVPDSGGPDTIATGDGDKHIIAGPGGDTAATGTGDDILIGDNGSVEYDSGIPALVYNTDPAIGGRDLLSSMAGTNIFIGGNGDDDIYGGSDRDAIFGDGGQVTLTDGSWHLVETINHFIGGDDWMDGGDGLDVMMGGAGHDTFVGSLADDLIIDTYGRVTIEPKTQDTKTVVRLDTISLIANTQEKLEGGRNIGTVHSVDFSMLEDILSGNNGISLESTGVHWLVSHDSHALAGFAGEATASHYHPGAYKKVPAGVKGDNDKPAANEEPLQDDTTGQEDTQSQEAPKSLWDNNSLAAVSEAYSPVHKTIPSEAAYPDDAAVGDGIVRYPGAGAAIAGMIGWKVVTGEAPSARSMIDRSSFRDLAKRQGKKRFKRWTSVGV